jgi:hypothetical protein
MYTALQLSHRSRDQAEYLIRGGYVSIREQIRYWPMSLWAGTWVSGCDGDIQAAYARKHGVRGLFMRINRMRRVLGLDLYTLPKA